MVGALIIVLAIAEWYWTANAQTVCWNLDTLLIEGSLPITPFLLLRRLHVVITRTMSGYVAIVRGGIHEIRSNAYHIVTQLPASKSMLSKPL